MGYKIDTLELIILSVLVVGIGVLAKIMNISHWIWTADFSMISYSYFIPFCGLIVTWSALLLILHKMNHRLIPIAIAFALGLVYNAFLMFGVFLTYPEVVILPYLLILTIVGMGLLTYFVVKD